MLIDEHLIKLLLAVFASHIHYLLVLQVVVNVSLLLLLLLLLLFLHGVHSRTEVLRSGFPVVTGLGLVEALALRHTHLLLLLQLGLLHQGGLRGVECTCSLEVIRLA